MPSRFRNPMNMPGALTQSGKPRNIGYDYRGIPQSPQTIQRLTRNNPAPTAPSGGGGSGGGGGGRSVSRAPSRAPSRPAAPKMPDFSAKARQQADKELQAQMAVIAQAIQAARSQADTQRADYEARGETARGEMQALYGALSDQTGSINDAINTVYSDAQQANEAAGQSLVDAIVNRAAQAQEGTQDRMQQAGIQGVSTQGMSDNLSTNEAIARNLAHTTDANMGLMGTAAQGMGEWNMQGVGHDQARRESDIEMAVMDMVSQLEQQLQQYLSEQEGRKLEVEAGRGGLERQIESFLRSQFAGSGGGGGGGSFGGGGFSGGSSLGGGGGGGFNPNVGLPDDAIPVNMDRFNFMTPEGNPANFMNPKAGLTGSPNRPARIGDTGVYRGPGGAGIAGTSAPMQQGIVKSILGLFGN